MTARQRRTAAVAPAAGYSRPQPVDPDGLRVTVLARDGKTKVFDFSAIEAPAGVVKPLVAVFAKVSGPTGTWEQMSTVQAGWQTLKRFLLFLAKDYPQVTEVKHLTRDVWLAWCAATETARGDNSAASMTRRLLGEVSGLPAESQMALRGTVQKVGERQTDAYTRDEVARIVKEARRVFAMLR